MKLKQISNGMKCKTCKGYTLDEIPNSHNVLQSPTTIGNEMVAIVDRKYLRKFRCRRCLAEFIEVDKNKELSPTEKYIKKQQEVE